MSQAAAEQIVVSELRGRVKWIRFNRPEVRNAIMPESADLARAEIEKAPSEGARVIVLTGSGGSFCAGADLKALAPRMAEVGSVKQILEESYHPLVTSMVNSPLPVIAAVDGAAAGIGADIALAADIRLASSQSFFAEIFVNISLVPDGGGTFHLPRLIGLGRALEMAMTGARISAEQAHTWGMVNHVYAGEDFEHQVQSYAAELAAKAPLALARSKMAMRTALNLSLSAALTQEAELQEELFKTNDFRAGVMAFISKQPPEFTGE